MTAINVHPDDSTPPPDPGERQAPAWAQAWIGPTSTRQWIQAGIECQLETGQHGSLLTLRLPRAVDLTADEFEAGTIALYQGIQKTLEASWHRFPVRIWNFIPSIHQRMDETRDRYMTFNGGRYKVYCDWFGGAAHFKEHLPTASGVGHDGSDMVVRCLSTAGAGVAVENPRQIPAFGYSKRYGPLPPCFARATLVDSLLLLGGTASIVGEQSTHLNSLRQQTAETLANLAAVVQEGAGRIGNSFGDTPSALAAFTSLRIYHPIASDREWIRHEVTDHFPGVQDIELARADLCRQELLIEIEGVAKLKD